jgi:hypothetical protein
MILIMIVSGILSSMWVWSDKISDVRISLNDGYMIALMTSFMIFFMSVLEKNVTYIIISLTFVGLVLYLIRFQKFVSKRQYFQGMIPHHSMAVHMSRRLLMNDTTLSEDEKIFVENIIRAQESEIDLMKSWM